MSASLSSAVIGVAGGSTRYLRCRASSPPGCCSKEQVQTWKRLSGFPAGDTRVPIGDNGSSGTRQVVIEARPAGDFPPRGEME